MLLSRPRRLRTTPQLRNLVRETRMSKTSLIYPMFVREGNGIIEDIQSLDGQKRYSPDTLCFGLEEVVKSGIEKVMLFGIPDAKDDIGSGAWAEDGVIQKALLQAKKQFPNLYYITDVCMCEYTSHGHCGALKGDYVDNDSTLELLKRTALSHVEAGSDMVAPSDMMDGRIEAIRMALDENGKITVPIMAYSAKYASAFYGPFREAAGSAPAFGDRKTYQMDYHNSKEAIKEARMDVSEGADIIMVKPALSYLDIIRQVSETVEVPVAAYSVSGEYAMIRSAAKAGLVDEDALICETATSIYRAGANILITYFAKELAKFMDQGRIG